MVETRLAKSESQAADFAQAIGFPVVLKLNSETITHKSDVGGVKLNLSGREAVIQGYREIESGVRKRPGRNIFTASPCSRWFSGDGYELILGSSVDTQFGPVVLFGSGGEMVEVYRDRALGLPPLNSTLATRLMEQTHIFRALQGVRGRPAVNMTALENALIDFSRLVIEQPWIKELDINPLVASPERVMALDARILCRTRRRRRNRCRARRSARTRCATFRRGPPRTA